LAKNGGEVGANPGLKFFKERATPYGYWQTKRGTGTMISPINAPLPENVEVGLGSIPSQLLASSLLVGDNLTAWPNQKQVSSKAQSGSYPILLVLAIGRLSGTKPSCE
jgi:hypothetical protein